MHFVVSRPGARLKCCAQADVVGMVRRTAVDLILLDVDTSLMAGFVLAAHVRAADRGRDACCSATIAAVTSSERNFRECLEGGSAIEGVLKLPSNLMHFGNFVDRWCLVDDFAKGPRDEAARMGRRRR